MIAFGPVPSRRLGLSQGINNIVSFKVCSYKYVYCQIGDTKRKSIMQQEFYKPEELFRNVKDHIEKLDKEHQPDYLTFVANGEPTLDINLGKEIRLLKQLEIPIAIITNSSFMGYPETRKNLMEVNWISVKVDSTDQQVWRKINRPSSDLDLDSILGGLKIFASEYEGKLHTETMLVKNMNDADEQAKKTALYIKSLNPETAFLSIPTRPPAVKEVKPVDEQNLAMVWQIFQDVGLETELLTGFEGTDVGFTGNAFEDILNISSVHPLREDTMEELLMKDNADKYVVQSLISQGLIKKTQHNGMAYYMRNYSFK